MIVDFILSILEKVFNALKKKSNSTYWKNMELVNIIDLKRKIINQIVEELGKQQNLTNKQILDLKLIIYSEQGIN